MSKFNFYERVDVNTTDFAEHRSRWTFNSTGIMLLNESTDTADIIQYSFNGVDLHGELRPNTPAAGLAFDNRTESAVYFRLASGASENIVRVEAWGSR